MDRIAISFGFIKIYWYSIFIFLGILFGSLFVYREAKKQHFNMDQLIDLVFYTVIVAIIGARAYYVLFNLEIYLSNPISIFEIWNGGLAIHGGILAGLLFLWFYTKRKKICFLKLLDIIVIGLIVGQIFGRWGNFFNGEAYGSIVSRVTLENLHIPKFIISGMYIEGFYHHPTFLYESFGNFIGLIILLVFRHYQYLKVGQLTGIYLIWYSILRFFIEGLRLDSLMLGGIRIAQLVSILMLFVGVYLVFIRNIGKPKLSCLYQKEEIYEKV